jgi:hypothetical protein
MELAVKRLAASRSSGDECSAPRRSEDVLRAYREIQARRAKEQQEFLARRRNLTNGVLNMPIL